MSAVSVSAGTAGTVTLNNMADGMGLSVNGKAGMGTTATVVHAMADRKVGDARYSGALDVSLAATGSKTDTKTNGTGEAMLTLTVDEEIEVLNVASSASTAGKASAAAYRNTLTLMGADTTGDSSHHYCFQRRGNRGHRQRKRDGRSCWKHSRNHECRGGLRSSRNLN